jgi:hypothetical protein
MKSFIIHFYINQKKASLHGDNGAKLDFDNVVIKEVPINERVYIVDADEEQKEHASLPFGVTTIITDYATAKFEPTTN